MPDPDTGDDRSVRPDRGSIAGTPRWMAVLGIIVAIALALLFVVLHVTGTFGPSAH